MTRGTRTRFAAPRGCSSPCRWRGSRGSSELQAGGRPLLALDPEGEPISLPAIDPRRVLAFGTERDGLSDGLLARADGRISIPMRPGVSSLNLATSVAAVLFSRRLLGA